MTENEKRGKIEVQSVRKEQLTGFRRPTESECSGMQDRVLKRLKRTNRTNGFWCIFLGIIDISMLLSLGGMNGASSEMMGTLVLAVILTAAVAALWIHGRSNRVLAGKVSRGEFVVLDCRVWELDVSVKIQNGALVRISSMAGQCCADGFRLRRGRVEEWKQNKDMAFILMKCKNEKSKDKDFYELF